MMKVVTLGPKLKKNCASTKMASLACPDMWLYANPHMMNRIVRMMKPPIWIGLRPSVSSVATDTQ